MIMMTYCDPGFKSADEVHESVVAEEVPHLRGSSAGWLLLLHFDHLYCCHFIACIDAYSTIITQLVLVQTMFIGLFFTVHLHRISNC